jgi:hypothetical protein
MDLIGTASDAATTSALLLVLGPGALEVALVALDPPEAKGVDTTASIRVHYPHLQTARIHSPSGQWRRVPTAC